MLTLAELLDAMSPPEASNPHATTSAAIPASPGGIHAGGKPCFAAERGKMDQRSWVSQDGGSALTKQADGGSESLLRSKDPFFRRAPNAVFSSQERRSPGERRPSQEPWSSQELLSSLRSSQELHWQSSHLQSKENWEFLRAAWNQQPQRRMSWQQHSPAGPPSSPQHPPQHPPGHAPQQPPPRTASLPQGHQRRSWHNTSLSSPLSPPQLPPTVARTPSLPHRREEAWAQQCHVAQPMPHAQSRHHADVSLVGLPEYAYHPRRRPAQLTTTEGAPRQLFMREADSIPPNPVFSGGKSAAKEGFAEKSPKTTTPNGAPTALTSSCADADEARRISALLHASNQGVMVQQRMAMSGVDSESRFVARARADAAADAAASAGRMQQLQLHAAGVSQAAAASMMTPTALATTNDAPRVEGNAAFKSWFSETPAFRSPPAATSGEGNGDLGFLDGGTLRARPGTLLRANADAADRNAYNHKRPWRVHSEDVVESVSCNHSPRYTVTCPVASYPPASTSLFGCSAFAPFNSLYTPFFQEKPDATAAASTPAISTPNPHKHIRLCHGVAPSSPAAFPHSPRGAADLARAEVATSGRESCAPVTTPNSTAPTCSFGLPVPGARVALIGPPMDAWSSGGGWRMCDASPVTMHLQAEHGGIGTTKSLSPLLPKETKHEVEEVVEGKEGHVGAMVGLEGPNEGEKGYECGEVFDDAVDDAPKEQHECFKDGDELVDLTLSLGGRSYIERA
ncbi:hypothetical protein CLOM_g23132 [Closterium sp. NIES-68]|nr:hypothetical protein CLOM_g23132 [Closterium sp. NIES-68]GJP83993.1 hypothetical protein CLOP_g14090 [Closterium sp. NIES-67]